MKGLRTVETISNNLGIDIRTRSRKRPYIQGRWIAFKALRSLGYTLQEIGDVFELDHSTVMHGLKQFDIEFRYSDFKTLCLKSKCFNKDFGYLNGRFCYPTVYSN